MKAKTNIAELVVLILASSVAIVLCTSVFGMIVHRNINPTPEDIAIREKIIDLLQTIVGAVIGVVSTMIATKKRDSNDDK